MCVHLKKKKTSHESVTNLPIEFFMTYHRQKAEAFSTFKSSKNFLII